MSKEYPQGKPFETKMFEVSPIHNIYLERSGNPKGPTLIHLHGGPGAYSRPKYRKFYNPEKYQIIQFDQRGCGKSTPLGETRENTTWDLVDDMEKIRKYLAIETWVVSGGSWGSTLALAYAEKYPERVKALIVRGVFTYRKWEADWFEKPMGVQMFFPEGWDKYENFIPGNERHDLVNAYAKRILAGDNEAARVADDWEMSLLTLLPSKNASEEPSKEDLAGRKIFYHYEKHMGFLKEGQLLKNAGKIKNIPGVIINGRYDMICPPLIAWELHKAWPESEFVIIDNAGHSSSEKGISRKIVEYADKFAK